MNFRNDYISFHLNILIVIFSAVYQNKLIMTNAVLKCIQTPKKGDTKWRCHTPDGEART